MSSKAKRARACDFYAGATLYGLGLDYDTPYGCVVTTLYRTHLTKRVEATKHWRNYRGRSVAIHRISDDFAYTSGDIIYHPMTDLGQDALSDSEQWFTSLAAAQRYAIGLITEHHKIVRPQGLSLTDTLIKMMAMSQEAYDRISREFVSHLVTQDAINDVLADIPVGTAGQSVKNNSVADENWS